MKRGFLAALRSGSFLRFSRIVLPLVACASLFVGFATARAYFQVMVWPPSGYSVQFSYPDSTWPCSPSTTWQHSQATEIYDNYAGGMYVYYNDAYNGSTTYPAAAYWSRMDFIDTKNGRTDSIYPPPATAVSTDWTVHRNQWYGYTSGTNEFMVETRLAVGSGVGCLGYSRVIFRH